MTDTRSKKDRMRSAVLSVQRELERILDSATDTAIDNAAMHYGLDWEELETAYEKADL